MAMKRLMKHTYDWDNFPIIAEEHAIFHKMIKEFIEMFNWKIQLNL